jgi:putative nucleotidyltransferase with HDIG domain
MKKFDLPTRRQCFEIIKEYHVPPHILKHSLAVAKLAVFLAQRLREKGEAADVDLVDRACLLHDIVRVCDFREIDYGNFEQTVSEQDEAKWRQLRAEYKELGHEDAAYEILKEKYPMLASTIRRHKYMAMLDEETRPKTWEEKLVYYADMRVMHDKIVPLETRLKEAHERNASLRSSEAQSKIEIAKIDPLIFRLEQEIFDRLALTPVALTDEFINSYPNNTQSIG